MVVRRSNIRLDDGTDAASLSSETHDLIPSNASASVLERTTTGSSKSRRMTPMTASTATATTTTTTTASLNLDHLTKLQQSVVSPSHRDNQNDQHHHESSSSMFRRTTKHRPSRPFVASGFTSSSTTNTSNNNDSWERSTARRCWILCRVKPISCGCLLVSVIVALFTALLRFGQLVNPVQYYGTLGRNSDYYTNIQSVYDLTMGNIDHWCLGGGDRHCPHCTDPLVPLHRGEHKSWIEAWKANRRLLERYKNTVEQPFPLDVVFVGESIVEELDGRWMGRTDRSEGLTILANVFGQHFTKSLNATVEGIALGIAGDTTSNVLWRLLHGEMPDHVQPKIWWLSLGTNDLARTECSEEVVVIGILRVVEEIMQRRPNAKIVINSMFPMTTTRDGLYPLISDFEDSFGRRRRRLSAAADGDEDAFTLSSTIRGKKHITKIKNNLDWIPHRTLRKHHSSVETGEPSYVELSEEVISTDMTVEAQKEEERRDQQGQERLKKQTKQRAMDRSPKHNPIMADRERTRTYELRQSPKPLWTSIRVINKALREFAANNKELVYFFDSTPMFTEKHRKSYKLLTDRITIRGHPTELGFRLWEDEMVTKVNDILNVMRREQPILFTAPLVRTNRIADVTAPVPKESRDDDEYSFALRTPYDDALPSSSKSTEADLLTNGGSTVVDVNDDDTGEDDPMDGGTLVTEYVGDSNDVLNDAADNTGHNI